MVRLNTRDAAVLARVAQYDKLPVERQQELLNALDGVAREIGLVLAGQIPPQNASVDAAEAADRISKWAWRNRQRPRFKQNRYLHNDAK